MAKVRLKQGKLNTLLLIHKKESKIEIRWSIDDHNSLLLMTQDRCVIDKLNTLLLIHQKEGKIEIGGKLDKQESKLLMHQD